MKRLYIIASVLFLAAFAGIAVRQEHTLPVFGGRHTLAAAPAAELIPMGMTVGVRINTDGVMVLGTGNFAGADGQSHSPAEGLLRAGDLILQVGNELITGKESLEEIIAESEGELVLLLNRDGAEKLVTLEPQAAAADSRRRIGAWVRDSTKGIGTLTFADPASQSFGALGHGIIDVDTKMLMSVKSGVIMPSKVTAVKRGERGAPGELEGIVETNLVLGHVTTNTTHGIFGRLDDALTDELPTPPMPAAHRGEIKTGPATILTNAVDSQVREFDIVIESVNRFTADPTKSMVIRITDKKLLEITGGIVQGMSGSPILQNGKIVGAITHVFVQDPTKGYAIFIEYMLQAMP